MGRFLRFRPEEDEVAPGDAPREDSTAEQRTVRQGQRHGDLIVISQGVEPGERIVVTASSA